MTKIDVEATIEICAPAEKIRHALIDFNTWPIWSPWLYIEPETQVTYRGEVGQAGHGYDWVGKKTGAGSMTLLSSTDCHIACDLQFLKPFKSEAKVAFDIQAIDDGQSRVTWSMKSSLPFYLFWMKPMMIGLIKLDYGRGLALLKDYVETGSIGSATAVEGIVDVDQTHYVGTRLNVVFTDLPKSIGDSFNTLVGASSAGQFSIDGPPMCIYNSMNLKSNHCDFTAALPTNDKVETLKAPLISALQPSCKALKVVHTGPYRHLGNAWSLIMAEAKDKKLKILKSQPPFEKYVNDPALVQEGDLITEVYLPIKD